MDPLRRIRKSELGKLSSELRRRKNRMKDERLKIEWRTKLHEEKIEKLKEKAEEYQSKAEHRRKMEKEKADRELAERRLKRYKQELFDYPLDIEKELKEASEKTRLCRRDYLKGVVQQVKEVVKKNGPLNGVKCGRCDKPFSLEESARPRMLKCGHTVCTSCNIEIRQEDEPSCPFQQYPLNEPASDVPVNQLVSIVCHST